MLVDLSFLQAILILTDVRREVTKLKLSLEDTVCIVIHPVGGRRKLVENSFDE